MIRSSSGIRSESVPNKRRRSEREDVEEKTYTHGPLDEVFGQHSAFPLTKDANNAEDVMKYLATVRQEAEADRCVHFVERGKEAKDGNSSSNSSSQAEHSEVSNVSSAPKVNATGAAAWRAELMGAFLTLKEEVSTHKDRIRLAASNLQSLPTTAASWRKYIFESNTPPTIDLLFNAVDHSTAVKLLIYCTQWLSASTPENLSRWIYMLFLRLDNLLDHSECAIVRGLAKKAIKLREKPDLSDMACYTVDMVITIVGEYYRQRDLLLVIY